MMSNENKKKGLDQRVKRIRLLKGQFFKHLQKEDYLEAKKLHDEISQLQSEMIKFLND